MRWKTCLFGAITAIALFSGARAQQPILRIGVLTDMTSGFSGWSGKGSVTAAQMAAEDYVKANPSFPYRIEVVSGDHQNKADVAATFARRWIDTENVAAVFDLPNSSAALAVNFALRDSKAALIVSGGGHDNLTTKECSPNTVQWTFDLWSLANSTTREAVARGLDQWYFITANFAGGLGLQQVATTFLERAGGKVVGSTLPPLGALDYASFLLQAQNSKARAIGLGMAGNDLMNLVKQAGEFGIAAGGQKLVALAIFIQDIHGLGLKAANGLVFTTAFYWDLDDGRRAWSLRFAERNGGDYPSEVHAGVYASALHYFKAVAASGSTDGRTVVAKMKELPTDDPLFGRGVVRADGRKVHDMYVVEVKKPEESTKPWDYLKVLSVTPAERAFRPASAQDCPSLVK